MHRRAWVLGLVPVVALAVMLAQAAAGYGMALGPARGGGKVVTGTDGLSKLAAPATSRISTENALPGTDEWASIGNYNISSLAAFPGAVSVNAGDPINIHVKSTGSSLSARLYRLGYYQNHGARLVTTYSGISTPAQPACTRVSSTGLVSCPWTPTFTINTDPSWISGIFLLRLDSNNGFRFFVYFTVRNDGYNSDILMMEASKTNQAYNDYGGESLYVSTNNEGRSRAYQVSFDRPYSTGAGTGYLFIHDIETVRWLEASGYDVSYFSDVDRASNPGLLLNHRVFMDQGHDEYWSWTEHDNVDAALAAGVNMVFASGNEAYWNIRLGSSSVGPNRVITCYKDSALDPTPVAPGVTVRFRDPELNRPDNILLGNGYQGYADDSLYRSPWVLYASPDRWYFDCTGLQAGDQVNNIVGEEWNATLDNGRGPTDLETVSRGIVIDNRFTSTLQESVIYTSTSGAQVFSAGTIHWSWGLIDHTYANQVFAAFNVSTDADHRIEQLTANVLDRFTGRWDGQPRPCGPANQGFYDIGTRPTRTPWPQAPTATGTPPTFTRTPTITRTRSATPTSAVTSTSQATSTRTQTPTITPTVCAGANTFSGSITTGDPTQAGRAVRDFVTSACGTQKSPLWADLTTPRHYDQYSVSNNTGSAQCVTVVLTTGCTGGNDIFAVAYLNSFNPAAITTNYLGDAGFSPGQDVGTSSFGVSVPAGSTLVVVVHEVTAGGGCGAYTLQVNGLACGTATASPTQTPVPPTNTLTPTASRTSTATATRTFTAVPSRTATNTNTATATSSRTSTATRTATATATDTDTPTPTATVTPGSKSVLVGHVTWQGVPAQPDARQQQPVSLTLQLGGTDIEYPAQTTDAWGYFTVTVDTLPAGTYDWRVKGPRTLANCGTVVLAGDPSTQAEMDIMKAGDADNNNLVTGTDFTILKLTFGRSDDLRADFNNDGVVGSPDFVLLKSNFGLAGCGGNS